MNRWKILTDHLDIFTLKNISDTRWEAKISCVKPVRYQISSVHDALITLSENEKSNHDVVHEAITLAEQLKDFSFIVSIIIWYDLLFQINAVSKMLQAKDMDMTECTKLFENCCGFLENYRQNGFKQAIIAAKELARELGIETEFKENKRVRRVKRLFDEITEDNIIADPEKKFEVDSFNPLLDASLASLKERFKQFGCYAQTWGFLFNIKSLPDKEKLLESCCNLENRLKFNNKSDINGRLLYDELISLKEFLTENFKDKIIPLIVLNFIKTHNLQELYQNVWIAMRILLTIPVTVASEERSFSKLKLIKTYLRTTMTQNRFSILGTLSIENEIADDLDFTELIQNFASKKARKVAF